MRVSVVVPAYNSARTLPRALAAIAAQELGEPFETIVVDNGSTDDTSAVVNAAPDGARVVRKEHAGPGSARNRGVAEAAGEVIAFTDADCAPQPGWLAAGVAALEGADLVQGVVRPPAGADPGPFDRVVAVGGESGLFETANLFVRRDTFDSTGGFEDVVAVEQPFGEDAVFGWRARRAGARVAFCADAVVEHDVTPRGPLGYVAERSRDGHFATLVREVPELRRQWLFARYFLTRRSAAFDLAVGGIGAALAVGSPAPAALALPYGLAVIRKARVWGTRLPVVAAADVAADAIGFGSLVAGSIRSRRAVL